VEHRLIPASLIRGRNFDTLLLSTVLAMINNPSNDTASKILRHILSTLAVLDLILGVMIYALRGKTKTRERRHVEDVRALKFYTIYALVVKHIRLVSSILHTMQKKSRSNPVLRLRADQ
jgi:hypothetical protein